MRELSDYLAIVRRRWAVLLAGLVLGLALAAFQVQSTPKTYTATSTVYVSMATGTSVADSYQGGLAAQQRVRSYMELVGSDTVLDRVIGQLGLRMSRDELRAKVVPDSPPATTLLRVTVTDEDPERTRALADEVISQFRALVDELETIERTAAPAARVAVVDRAETPSGPSGPQGSRLLVVGALAGLVLGAGLALLWERLDRRVRGAADLAPLGRPMLGTVALGADSERDDLRAVRSRLPDGARTVLVTGLGARSEPALALALAGALAATGNRVLLVDADTTRTGVSALLPVPEIDWPVRTGRPAPQAPMPAPAPQTPQTPQPPLPSLPPGMAGRPAPQPDLAKVGGGVEHVNATQQTTVLDLRTIPDAPPREPAPPPAPAAPRQTGGLAAVLRGEETVDEAVTLWPDADFSVLRLGTADGQTSDLLASGRLETLLRAARERFDHVVVDTAAPAAAPDALAVAPKCASTVTVAVLRETNAGTARDTLAALDAAGARVTGIVAVPSPRNAWQRLTRRGVATHAAALVPGPQR